MKLTLFSGWGFVDADQNITSRKRGLGANVANKLE